MSLFCLLLTGFTMEQTVFRDYEARLELDNVLLRMRDDFVRYKEDLRKELTVR